MNTELTDDQLNSIPFFGGLSDHALRRFARAVIAADRALQDARHREELAAYELTVTNLRAAQSTPDIHALFCKLRSKILKLPRYSFLSPQGGGVVKVPDNCGKWIEVYDAAGLCEVEEVDALIAAAPQPAAQPERQINTVTATAPREIWLRVRDDSTHCDKPFPDVHGPMVTWGRESIMACEVHYIRADVAGAAQPERGQIVVTKNEAGQIVAVTRQDEEGKILEVIAMDIRFEREPEPKPTSVSLSKRAELEAHGYVVNGVALMHLETRRRVLLDYCGFVGWCGPIPKDEK